MIKSRYDQTSIQYVQKFNEIFNLYKNALQRNLMTRVKL